MKKFASIIGIFMCISTAYAMELNISLGEDMKKNKNSLHFKRQHCAWDGKISKLDCNMLDVKGIFPEFIDEALERFKKRAKEFQPDGSDKSYIELGYVKNNVDVYPASCKKIILRNRVDIVIREDGCVVS